MEKAVSETRSPSMETARTHRVGTVTLGITLITFGVIYMLRLFIPEIPVMLIMNFWPLPMIILGLELLISGFVKKNLIIDKASIVLCFLVIIFIFGMASAEFMIDKLSVTAFG